MVKLNDAQQKVLVCLAEDYSSHDMGYSAFASLMQETKLDRSVVRLACRSLKRKGLAKFGFGLWTEDGEPRGSGYAATKAGAELAETLPKDCESCGRNPADLPGRICVGCEAYQDHQR